MSSQKKGGLQGQASAHAHEVVSSEPDVRQIALSACHRRVASVVFGPERGGLSGLLLGLLVVLPRAEAYYSCSSDADCQYPTCNDNSCPEFDQDRSNCNNGVWDVECYDFGEISGKSCGGWGLDGWVYDVALPLSGPSWCLLSCVCCWKVQPRWKKWSREQSVPGM